MIALSNVSVVSEVLEQCIEIFLHTPRNQVFSPICPVNGAPPSPGWRKGLGIPNPNEGWPEHILPVVIGIVGNDWQLLVQIQEVRQLLALALCPLDCVIGPELLVVHPVSLEGTIGDIPSREEVSVVSECLDLFYLDVEADDDLNGLILAAVINEPAGLCVKDVEALAVLRLSIFLPCLVVLSKLCGDGT